MTATSPTPSAQTLLVLTDLIPPEGRVGPETACAIWTRARGSVEGREVDVLLADRDAIVEGLPESLSPLLAAAPSELRLTPSGCDPAGDRALLDAVRSSAPELPIHIAGEGQAPPTLTLDDLGELSALLLLNGLRWVERADPALSRPDRLVNIELEELGPALHRYAALCDRRFDGPPPARALRLQLHGAGLFGPEFKPKEVAATVLGSRLRLDRLELTAPPPQAARRAAELALRVSLGAPWRAAPKLSIDGEPQTPQALLASLPVTERLGDDVTRRVVFSVLTDLTADQRTAAGPRAEAALGPAREWIAAFQRYRRQGATRVVAIPTWQCELRCRYCPIVKQDGRVMSPAVLDGALDLLLSSESDKLELHFFGGEPFLNWPLLKHAVIEGTRRAEDQGRDLRFLFTTNAYSLTEEQLDWLAGRNITFQLSLDGKPETMHAFRRAEDRSADSYLLSPANRAASFVDRKIPHDLIQVVHPDNVTQMADNFRHIIDMGYRVMQLNYTYGVPWPIEAVRAWADGLYEIGAELEKRWAAGQDLVLVNLLETLKSYRTNLHPTVDWDGTVYAGTGFLYLEQRKPSFRLGHIDDGHAYHRYVVDSLDEEDFFERWYWRGTVADNMRVGGVLKSFVRWMRQRNPERLPAKALPLDASVRTPPEPPTAPEPLC